MARFTKRMQQQVALPAEIHDDPVQWSRSYQIPLAKAFFLDRKDRIVCVWPRKTGKDYYLAMLAKHAMFQRPGCLVCHVLPTFKQAKDIVWEGPCDKGRFRDIIFPPELVEDQSESEMMIRLKDGYGTRGGSVYQLQGAGEQMQRRRGPNATGVILSEYQDMPDTVFEEIYEPMIVSNRGWAAFIGTPRGKNHLYKMFTYASEKAREAGSRWFCQLLKRHQCRKNAPGEDGSEVVSDADIQEMLARGMPRELVEQEYNCSFDGFQVGSIYGDLMAQAYRDGRVDRVPYEVNLPVGVAFDIGRTDGTACVFYQVAAREVRILDYFACRGRGADYIVKVLKDRRPYLYGRMVLPHDARIKGFAEGRSTEEFFDEQWPGMVIIVEKQTVQAGVDMFRRSFGKIVFDKTKCEMPQEDNMPSLLESIGNYRRVYDSEKKDYSGEPVHDQYSHGADAMRYLAVDDFQTPEWFSEAEMVASAQPAVTYFNVFTYQKDRVK